MSITPDHPGVAESRSISILLIEDDTDYVPLIRDELEDGFGGGVELTHVALLAEGLVCIQKRKFDAVLLDLHLPDSSGPDTYIAIQQEVADLPVIVLSGDYDRSAAARVLRLGAQDFIHKDHSTGRVLGHTIRHAIDRQHFAAELERSRQRVRRILEAAIDAILIIDGGGVVQLANPAAMAMFARGDDELIGQPFGFPVNHNDICELDIPSRDGRIRVAEMRVTSIDWEGKPAFLAALRDLTERTEAVQQLRLSERRFRALIESSSDAISILDEDCRFIYDSPALQRVMGFKPLERLGSLLLDSVHTMDRPKMELHLQELLANPGKPCSAVWQARHRDGELRWLEGVSTNLLLDPAVAGIVTNYRDVTARRLAEERVREQATLLDRARDAIVVRDLSNVITFWNKGAERLYGIPASMAVGADVTELLFSDTSMFLEASKVLWRKEDWTGEFNYERPDSTTIVVQARWTLLRDDKGEPQATLSIDTDITEQKKLELQFLRAQRMESIGTLAGGIAHDINNILAPILMALSLLKLDATDDDMVETLQMLESSANRGKDLVRQVLAFSRGVEGERVVLQPAHVARELVQIARDTFPKSISIDMSSQAELRMVEGDPTQIHQILMNLCVNARDAMPFGGALQIRLENVIIDETYAEMNRSAKPGSYVMIKVRDSGQGIPPAVRERIFEPFFTTKEIGHGTGLGLSTVMAIIKSHGGFINVYSEIGKGTTFRVYLPAVIASEELVSSGGGVVPAPDGCGETVLVVDDEAAIRMVAQLTLEKRGYKVLVASNGAEGVSVFVRNRERIGVVLTDMAMPVMDGPAMIVALRSIEPDVAIVSSSGLSDARDNAMIPGATTKYFLPKPYVAEALLIVLRQALEERRSAI